MTRNRHFELAGTEYTDNWNRVVIPRRVMDRAHAKTTRSINGCWISGYSVASHGYAQIGWNDGPAGRHVFLAHRAVWERFNGPVPSRMTLDHRCRQRRCVNPNHLRLLENFENGRRTHGMDWRVGECANGHPNSMLADDPHRRDKLGNPRVGKRCSECKKVYANRRNWKVRHPGEPLPESLLLASEHHEFEVAA